MRLTAPLPRSIAMAVSAIVFQALTINTAWAQAPTGDEAAHVYFLLAIDTVTPNSKSLGLDLDRDNFASTVRGAMKNLGYKEGPGGRFSIRILQDGEMSEKMVLDYFRKLKAS